MGWPAHDNVRAMNAPSTVEPTRSARAGFQAALAAYLIWGLLPLYLMLVSFADPREVLGQRILWCLPATLIGVFTLGGWRHGLSELRAALRPKLIGALALSAAFIFVNWAIYVWAVAAHRVIDAALAYFLAPLVQAGLGVIFFKEKLSPWQGAALACAGAGVVIQGLALGVFPWISITLCLTWCAYALVRKQAVVPAAAGLFIETTLLAPLAVALLLSLGAAATFDDNAGRAALLALAGPATAIPLALFAYGARRLSFTTIGLLQYIAPSLQFAVGALAGEPLNALRLVSFAIIWIGLALYTYDAMRRDKD